MHSDRSVLVLGDETILPDGYFTDYYWLFDEGRLQVQYNSDTDAAERRDFENLEGIGPYVDFDEWEEQNQEASLQDFVRLIRTKVIGEREDQDTNRPPCIVVAVTAPNNGASTSRVRLEYEAKRAAIVDAGAIFYEKVGAHPRDEFKSRFQTILKETNTGTASSEQDAAERRGQRRLELNSPEEGSVSTGRPVGGHGDVLSEGNEEELFKEDRLAYGRPPFAVSASEYETLWSRLKMPDEDWRKDE